MNQILSVNMPNKTNNKNKKIAIKPIIIFFCIILLIFGISMIAIGISANIKSGNSKNNDNLFIEDKPKIQIVQGSSTLNVAVSSEKGVDKIIYKWNNEDATQINGNNEKTMSVEIKIPLGRNILSITATDKEGVNETFEKEYTGIEEYKPEIILSQKNNLLNLKCISESAIKYISYHFDQDEEKLEEINNLNGEAFIKIIEGKHTLSVKVVDINERQYEEKKEIYIPILKAKTSVDRKKFTITAEDERGLAKIEVTVNGEKITKDISGTSYTEEFELKEGEDRIIVSVTNIDNLSIIKGFK